jgi:hypothetical protein
VIGARECSNEPTGFLWRISSLVQHLLACQKGLCSMELVTTPSNGRLRPPVPNFIKISSADVQPKHAVRPTGLHSCFYICIVHTVVLFQSLVGICHLTQHVNLLSGTHYTGDMFRLPSSHHQAYVNIRMITDHCVCL